MSLAQHVSSIEGVDRNPLGSSSDSDYPALIGQVLNYDAFPPPQIEDKADHIAPYKVSTTRRAGESTLFDREK
jgi:hypothetical protein